VTRRSAVFAERKQRATSDWQHVRSALKSNEAAVEFVRFAYWDRTKWAMKTFYVALLVRSETAGKGQGIPILIPIGDTTDLGGEPMDDYQQRVAMGPPASADTGTAFYRAFWKPLEPFLAGITRVYVAPDGVLNRISWAAVPSDDGRLLIEKYDIQVLLSTKDLLIAERPSVNRTAVLIGNPIFDLTEHEQEQALAALGGNAQPNPPSTRLATATTDPHRSNDPNNATTNVQRAQLSRDAQGLTLDPLPGTQKEIESVENLLKSQGWQVAVYTRQNALEEVIRDAKRPRLLHVATHGFFEPDQTPAPGLQAPDRPAIGDPMLRSGLYFAGANRTLAGHPSGDLDNGILTAFEATGLNLQGTELVVLSACETGLGHIQNGEGVFGLQRAMQEAGAEAVLMSMWSVPDVETQQLMTTFYSKWLSGMSKHEALHDAQLELWKETRAKQGDDRPYYWAAFVLVGR
jgi:CHAT domain-containing protein